MIVRTYQRRNRNIGRTLSDSSFSYGEEEALSQGSSQEHYHVPFSVGSSQESSSWSQAQADYYEPNLKGKSSATVQAQKPSARRRTQTPISTSSGIVHGNGNVRPSSKGDASRSASVWGPCAPPTSTLMEAQESGEMMEHVDEANFALDGLRPGQPLRIQRASLLSLLSICSSVQQRRLLRTQGMAKPVLDSIVALSTDDPPIAVAAATLFYVLASDGQDEHLLDTEVCIQFLLKLLFPSVPEASEKMTSSLGCKLLRTAANSRVVKASSSGFDRDGVAIMSKVRKLLSSVKEINVGSSEEDGDTDFVPRQELSSKWLALLTLEKACLSTVALEDTSGSVRRVGGHFKERLRELGGLDAVCEVALNCFAILKDALENQDWAAGLKSFKATEIPESVAMLLKCMKVMENATFLSEHNQKHLLEMNLESKSKGPELSFIALVISSIKMLSELALRHKSQRSVYGRQEEESIVGNGHIIPISKSGTDAEKELLMSSTFTAQDEDLKGNKDSITQAYGSNAGRGRRKTVKLSALQDEVANSRIFEKNKSISSVSSLPFSVAGSNNNHALADETLHCKESGNGLLGGSSKERVTVSKSFASAQADGAGNSCTGMKSLKSLGQRSRKLAEQKRSTCFEDSQDPFAFNEDVAPVKSKQINTQKRLKARRGSTYGTRGKLDNEYDSQVSYGAVDLVSEKEQGSYDNKVTDREWAEGDALLGDCLLSAVKVLMNLTNDNPIGCQQVAAGGGLNTMASLIVGHYPLFQSHVFPYGRHSENDTGSKSADNRSTDFNQADEALSDQDLDLLVVVLGVLVNLVEKDTGNRARLAALSVTLPGGAGGCSDLRGCRRGVIALLCSIFLTKHGSGEAVEGGGMIAMESNDEAAVKQGQREAENMIVEAYAALLLGFLSKESENARHAIAACLPDHNLKVLVPVLERFVAFHLSLNMISAETHAAVREVIESCKQS